MAHPPAAVARRSTPEELASARARVSQTVATMEMLNHVPDLVLLLDANRQVVFANQAMQKTMECSGDGELVGQRAGDLFSCKHAHESEGGCGTTESCRSCGAFQAIVRAQQGHDATEDCRIAVKRDSHEEALDLRVWSRPVEVGGQHLTLLGAHDIADEKRKAFLERIFLHDLMNTAIALRGFSALVEPGQVESGPERDEMLQHIHALSNRIVDEINGHRQLMAAERDELVAQPQALRSGAFLKEILDTYQRADLLEGRRLVLAPDSLDVPFECDPSLLGRVIGNMTKNAIEASLPGELITLGCSALPGEIVFRVNNPAVMPQRVRLQVFNRSFSTKGAGRGLGTYSMKYLTEKYLRGHLSFSSVEGEGTTFVARYPLGPPREFKPARPAPRVVVADDEHVLRLMLRAALKREGCEVIEASNGAEALRAARTQRPDVVLLDVNMPVFSGEAALVALRAELPEVLVLMLTAEEDPALDARCLALGSARCLKKSTALPDLVSAVLQTWNDASREVEQQHLGAADPLE